MASELAAAGSSGVVYTASNETDGNEVLAFHRAADGTLSPAGSFPTGGNGTGADLGTQGSVVLGRDGRVLLVVNAGSHTVSLFLVTPTGLELLDVASSHGEMPVSVTNHGRFVYVLNAGGAGNIAGFRITARGKLVFINGSVRPLSNGGGGASVGPAQVAFTPDGQHLAVTEKMTNLIDIYAVGPGGIALGPKVFPSSGVTPFGFAFTKRSVMVVSEAFMGAPNASATSSYRLSGRALDVISPSVPDGQSAACWVVITGDQRYAYVSNTGSNNVSSYTIGADGTLSLHQAVAGQTGGAPSDEALSRGSDYLYTIDVMANAISAFRVRADGSLEQVDFETGLPAMAYGLAAR
jgi:6-phosphogluconolactonase (cycloisomerase 2 family)